MLAKILGCQRIVEMPTGMHNNNGAINGRRREKEFRTNIKKKESEGRTESMKIDQLSVNAVFV